MPPREHHRVIDGEQQIEIAIAVEIAALEQLAGARPAGFKAVRRAAMQHQAVTLGQDIADAVGIGVERAHHARVLAGDEADTIGECAVPQAAVKLELHLRRVIPR